MRKLASFLFISSLCSLYGFVWPFSSTTTLPGSTNWLTREEQVLRSEANNIDPNVLHLSLIAYLHARHRGLDHKQMLTIIDYSKPSTEKRLWVFDLSKARVLYNTWVAHGKNSGGLVPTSFSNAPGSLKSSIGVFVTDRPYIGDNGYSLRLSGLDQGYNDNAFRRDIVIHGANYVNPGIIQRYGQIGRSWGCPAVSKTLSHAIIDKIKDNTIVFAYYPDRSWLSHSIFLTA